jgi:hypothetical protein
MVEHNYKEIEGWFNMEDQYLELLKNTPEEGIFVELGAYKGKSTSFIATEIINRGRNIQFYTFMGITAVITIIPIVYSYRIFNKIKKS